MRSQPSGTPITPTARNARASAPRHARSPITSAPSAHAAPNSTMANGPYHAVPVDIAAAVSAYTTAPATSTPNARIQRGSLTARSDPTITSAPYVRSAGAEPWPFVVTNGDDSAPATAM